MLDDQDTLARLALERKSHRRADNTVKPKAFQPARDGCLSTFNITGMGHQSVKSHGVLYVAQPRNKTLYGWSETTVKNFQNLGLTVNPDNDPPRHVNVTGWPSESSECLLIQLELAKNSTFREA